MHRLMHFGLMTLILTVIVYLLLVPQQAAIYHNPLAVVGLGMIGLGLCKMARECNWMMDDG
ncbi:MAG: hypothetical protein IT445_10070 [Phycisphaeraceae bacterium]|nr:hypothetical protein [Phycisphaeraceae bacterium]